jgi:hypothetical protein
MKTYFLKNKYSICVGLFALSLLTVFLYAKNKAPYSITNIDDYAAYLIQTNTATKAIEGEMAFWNKKLMIDPNDIIAKSKIASYYTKHFQATGSIQDVHIADSLYKVVNTLNHKTASGTFRSLAANCITQHQFKQAKLYVDSALALGDDKFSSLLLSADVELELGNIEITENILTGLPNTYFEVLIRLAKLQDHKGDLEAAIAIMEKAFDKINNGSNTDLYNWTLSNLGDMYGHNNQYQKSYNCYLKVLAKNPQYYHCLKGIAWLAFSKDKNTIAAKQILNFLEAQHPVPDYKLLLAEIAAYEKSEATKTSLLEQYTTFTSNPLYGDMYNKYNFYLHANEWMQKQEALQIALIEVNNRPTPESYNLLSWAYYTNGNTAKAYEIAKAHVANKCFEPDAVGNLAIIYKAAGNTAIARQFFSEVQDSQFELGPVKWERISSAYKLL